MNLADSKIFRWVVCPPVLLLSFVWCFATARNFGQLLFLATVVLYITISWHRRARWVIIAWLGFVFFSLLPVDVSFRDRPGPPRFVRYVTGPITEEDLRGRKQGEVIFGGCNRSGLEPKWLWVW